MDRAILRADIGFYIGIQFSGGFQKLVALI